MLVELEHARHGPVEERPVVRHDHRTAREVVVEEALEAVEPGEVEVVGRLVQQEHVEARQQDRREVRPGGLPAGEGRHLEVERAFGQAEVGEHRADARIEVGGAEREVLVERVRVEIGGAFVDPGERVAGLVEAQLGRGHSGAAGEERAHGLAGAPVGLLRQVADGRGGRRADDRSGVGRLDAGEDAQQRALAGAVGRDDADPAPRTDGQADPVEHDVRPEGLGHVAGDESGERLTSASLGARSGRGRGHGGTCGDERTGRARKYRARRRSGGPDSLATRAPVVGGPKVEAACVSPTSACRIAA